MAENQTAQAADTPVVGDVDPQGQTRPGELHIEVGKDKPIEAKPLTEGEGSGAASAGRSQKSLMAEAYRRGILPADKKAAYEEAMRRGLVTPDREPSKSILTEALADPGGMAAKIAKGAVVNAEKRKERATQVIRKLRGMADDVDYDTGLPWAAKVAVKDSDNPTEARLALEKLFGPGNAGQDKGGRWWVKTKSGKKVAVFAEGASGAFGEGMAGAQASGPEAAGALTGGAIGLAGGPLGVLAGTGLGGAAGKGLDELSKAIRGVLSKSPSEEAGALAVSGAVNAGAEGAGQALRGTGRGIMGLLRQKYWETTPDSNAMAENLLRKGAVPPLVTVAPGAKSAQYDQMLRNMVKGDPQRAKNIKFANQRLFDMLQMAGVPDDEIRDVFAAIVDPRRAISLRVEGETVTRGVQEHISGLEREANVAMETARGIVDRAEKQLEALGQNPETGNVHQLFNTAATESRRRFGGAMSRVYEDIDTMTGGKVIVPTALMKKAAQDVLSVMPSTNAPTIFHEVVGMPNKLTIKEAQRLRTRLREAADSGNLTPGTIEHDYNEVARSVDAAMDPAGIPDQKSMPAEALRALEAADKAYAEGIAKYRDAKLNQMLRDYRNQKVLDPEKFAASLFDTQSAFRVRNYREIVGEQTWSIVQAADARNIFRAARRLASDASSATRIDGQALSTILETRGPMLDAIYGAEKAKQWREYARQLAALDGKIDARVLTPDSFGIALQTAVTRRQQLEDFVKNDVLRALKRGGPEEIDAAINVLVKPGQEAELDHVIRFFGEDSPEVKAIRSAAIKKALTSAVMTDKTGLETRIGGEAIDAFLKKFTRREQQMLFPNGLDTDLRILADEMKALFPPSYQDMGGSLAAASIKGKVPFSPVADIKWLHVAFKGWLADRPTVIRIIAGIKDPPSEAKLIRQAAVRVMWKQFLNEQAQSVGSTAQTTQAQQ